MEVAHKIVLPTDEVEGISVEPNTFCDICSKKAYWFARLSCMEFDFSIKLTQHEWACVTLTCNPYRQIKSMAA